MAVALVLAHLLCWVIQCHMLLAHRQEQKSFCDQLCQQDLGTEQSLPNKLLHKEGRSSLLGILLSMMVHNEF